MSRSTSSQIHIKPRARRGRWFAVALVALVGAAWLAWASQPAPEARPQWREAPSRPASWFPKAPAQLPMAAPEPAVLAPPHAAMAVPAVPAAAPFRFVGQWSQNGDVTAILRRDGQSAFVHRGDRLGSYRVLFIDDSMVVLEDVEHHAQHVLPLQSDSGLAARGAAARPDPGNAPGASAGSSDDEALTN